MFIIHREMNAGGRQAGRKRGFAAPGIPQTCRRRDGAYVECAESLDRGFYEKRAGQTATGHQPQESHCSCEQGEPQARAGSVGSGHGLL